jgi:cellulase
VRIPITSFKATHTDPPNRNVLVNGKDQGVGNKQGGYIDSPPNNNPVLDVTSKDIECNAAGVKASKSISINGGDEVTFQWYHDTNSAGDDIIASVCRSPSTCLLDPISNFDPVP